MGGLGTGVNRTLEDIEADDFAREWFLGGGRAPGIGSGLWGEDLLGVRRVEQDDILQRGGVPWRLVIC
jgi:hypothetical protein